MCTAVSFNIKYDRQLLYRTQLIVIYLSHFDLSQRPSVEEVYSVLLPVLATVEWWRGKKSALTDHTSHDNNVVSWKASVVLDRELDGNTRCIRAVYIWKDQQTMNRSEGRYTLIHTYDRFLATSQLYSVKNWKKNWINFWWRTLVEIKTSKVNNDRLCLIRLFY